MPRKTANKLGFGEILTENRQLRKDKEELKQKIKEISSPAKTPQTGRKNSHATSGPSGKKGIRELEPLIAELRACKISTDASTQTELGGCGDKDFPCTACPTAFQYCDEPIVKGFAVPESWLGMHELTPGMALEWTIKVSQEAIQVHTDNKELKADIQRLQHEANLASQLNEERWCKILQLEKQLEAYREEVGEMKWRLEKREGKRKMSEALVEQPGRFEIQQPAPKRARYAPENSSPFIAWNPVNQ